MGDIIPFTQPVPETPLEYALAYAAIGWHVLPLWWIRGDKKCACGSSLCGAPGKHPLGVVVAKGANSATTDPETIEKWWTRYPTANVGVALHASGMVAVDIDPRNGGHITFDALEDQRGKISSELEQITGGNGRHIFFSAPPNLHGLPGTLGPGIDLKANGFCVVEPSNHVLGEYGWEASSSPLDGNAPSPLPDWIRDLAQRPTDITQTLGGLVHVAQSVIDELRMALAYIGPDDYHQWVNCGLALCELGKPGFGLWDAWSQRSTKYTPEASPRKWASFRPDGTLHYQSVFTWAVQGGWVNVSADTFPPTPDAVDFSGLIAHSATQLATMSPRPEDAPAERESSKSNDYQFPAHLLKVPGLVGDIARYMNATAKYPQPVLHLAASLSFCGAIMGRKIRTESNIRTNLYALGVAFSGSGKEHGRKCIKRLAVESGELGIVGAEKIASDAGLFDLLDQHPSTLWLADEFGRVLRAMTDKRAPSYLVGISTQIMELSGSADSFLIESRKAGSGSDAKPVRVVQQPNLCIYGTTVPGRLFQSMTPDDIQDGFLPRWLLFESDTPDPEEFYPGEFDAARLVEAIKAWHDRPLGTMGNLAHLAPDPYTVPTTNGAEKVFSEYGARWRVKKIESRGHGLDAVWARALEHALRLALIRAGGESFGHPEIGEDCAAWACELTEFLLSRSCKQALDCVATSEYDGNSKKFAAYIRDHSPIKLSCVTKRFKNIKTAERNDIMTTLIAANLVSITQDIAQGGRPAQWVHWNDGHE